jgi:hypothetical protein
MLWETRTGSIAKSGLEAYAPELNKRCRPHLKPTNKSYRTDETYIKVKGKDKFLVPWTPPVRQSIFCSPRSAMLRLRNASPVRL